MKLFHKVEFENIVGHDDIKNLVRTKLQSSPWSTGCAKTLFLHGILECRNGVYFDASNTTNRILDVLEEERPKIICIDELDKMPKTFENQLLNFMECSRVKVDQQKRQFDFEIRGAKVLFPIKDAEGVEKLSKAQCDSICHFHARHRVDT